MTSPSDANSCERLKKEQKRKQEADAHLYTIIKVARDQDLAKQIGKDIFFDLVDHDKVRSFRIQKQTAFAVFKEEMAEEFGIPEEFMRFWLWAKRQNHTYRPSRPLSLVEECQSVSYLAGKTSDKTNDAELNLLLEINLTPDLKPIPLPEKTNSDILLFLKLYDPEKEELRYVRSLFVKALGKPYDILEKLKEMARFAPSDEIELFEEIRFQPSVMCEHIDRNLTFRENELGDGDIICYQKVLSKEDEKQYLFPDVPSFLDYLQRLQVSTDQDRLAYVRDLRRVERILIAAQRENLQAQLKALQAQLALVTADRNAVVMARDRFRRERDEARQQVDCGLGQAFRDVAYFSGRSTYFQALLMTHAPHVRIPPYSQVVSEDKLLGYRGTSNITISGSAEGKSLRRPEGHGKSSACPQ